MISGTMRTTWHIALAAIFVAACQAAPPPTPSLPPTQALPSPEPSPVATEEATLPEAMEITTTEDLNYARDQLMDVYAPSTPGDWPVVVLLHGGGGITKVYVRPLARAIAGQGAVVFVPTFACYEPPPAWITLGADDAACAVRYARANAAAYGGDASRVIVAGHSGGAAYAVLVALAGDDYHGDCRATGVSGRADGVVGLDGAYDLIRYVSASNLESAPADDWLAISPFAQIERQPHRQGVTFRLFAGRETEIIQNGQAMRDALLSAGYDASLTQIPGVYHMGMSGVLPQTVPAILEMARGG
jgi:acetyl esterase/lipase